MAFNLGEFKAKLTLGGARPTLFQVTMGAPPGVATIQNDFADLPFMVTSTTLPGSSLGFVEVPYFGRKIRLSGDRTFEPWTVTIINDEDFKIRHGMERWHHTMNNLASGVSGLPNASPGQYKADASVIQYGKKGDPLRTYKFEGLFPIAISTIDVNWNDTDAIEYFQVTFQYDWFTVEASSPGASGNLA